MNPRQAPRSCLRVVQAFPDSRPFRHPRVRCHNVSYLLWDKVHCCGYAGGLPRLVSFSAAWSHSPQTHMARDSGNLLIPKGARYFRIIDVSSIVTASPAKVTLLCMGTNTHTTFECQPSPRSFRKRSLRSPSVQQRRTWAWHCYLAAL